MFFILSKLLVFIITPSIWIIALLVIGIYSKSEKIRKKSIGWSLVLFLFFTNGFVYNEFMKAWEIPASNELQLKKYDAGIVLGGMSIYDEKLDRVQFFRGVDRLLHAVELYRKGVIDKIIFTGGSGLIFHPEMKEGIYLKRYMNYFNIPEEDFIMETESKNTHENAVFTKNILTQQQIHGNYLLITSGFHMRRSLGCFKKAGIRVEPYSTDRYSVERKFEFDTLFIPNSSVMDNWRTLIHEVAGYLIYKIMG